MKSLEILALSLVPILLPACGQQLVEFRNSGTGQPDVGVTDAGSDDGEDAELILETLTSGEQDRDAASADHAAVDAVIDGSADWDSRR